MAPRRFRVARVVRTDDFTFRARRPAGGVTTLASLAAGLVHRLTQQPAVMLPRRTIIAADRSRLRAAKPSDRAEWKTSLAVAVIRIAAAAGGIRAVAAAGRVLVFATNRVGRAAAVATRHQVIWTASGTAASVSAAPEGAKTQRPRCGKADENSCHPPTIGSLGVLVSQNSPSLACVSMRRTHDGMR
jgi:hypothetical protein